MPYSIWLTSIEETTLQPELFQSYCRNKPHLKFDTSKTWTDIYDQIILFKNGDEWDIVCGIKNGSVRAACEGPDSPAFFHVADLADYLNLFVVGEENEIYYIPNYGKPNNRLDFDLAKQAFKENGYNLKVITEKSAIA
jgi:hypothetical protein